MANRPRGYGMTAEIAQKMASKYDVDLEIQAREWIEAITHEPLEPALTDTDPKEASRNMHRALMNGVALCKVMNILEPGSIKKVNTGTTMAFKLMENIGKFLEAAVKYGCRREDLFQTVALYENQNMVQVIGGIHALGRQAQKKGFSGPILGPKESTANKREFSEDQLKEGQSIIGLQMGSNKGASQAGMSMGKTRHIID